MKYIGSIVIVWFIIQPLRAHHSNAGTVEVEWNAGTAFTMELYFDEAPSINGSHLAESFRSIFSKLDFKFLKSIEKHPKHPRAPNTLYGLIAFANCPNFVILNDHIEEGFYNKSYSIVVAVESCPRKNYVGQLQYILPTQDSDNLIQIVSDLIRVDQIIRDWHAVNLHFDDYSESMIDDVVHSSPFKYGHLNPKILFYLYKNPPVRCESPDGHLMKSPYTIVNEDIENNNFLLFVNYSSATTIIHQVLESSRATDSFEFFTLQSHWIVVLTKPLVSNENVESFFETNLTNLAVVVPSVMKDGANLLKDSIGCLLVTMEKSLSVVGSNDSSKENVEKGILQTQSCFDNVPPWTVHNSLITAGTSTIKKTKWIPGYGFNHSTDGIFINSGPMKTIVIRGFIDHNPPWQIINGKCNESTVQSATGIAVQIMLELQRRLSFELQLLCLNKVIDRRDALSNSSSHWDLVSSVLRQRRADIYVGASIIRPEREQEVDFMVPFQMEPYVVVSGRPKWKRQVTLFIDTFEFEVWMVLLSLALLFIFSFAVFRLITTNSYKTWMSTRLKLSESYIITIGVLLQQSVNLISNFYSIGALLLTWLVASIVICGSYNGRLFWFMTIPRYTQGIETLDDLLSQTSLTWGIDRHTFVNSMISDSKDTKIIEFRDNAVIHSGITENVISAIKQRQHVLIEGETKAKQIVNKEFGKTGHKMVGFMLGDPCFYDRMSFALYKNHPLTEMLNKELMHMISTGVIDKLKRDFSPPHSYKFMILSPTVRENSIKFTIYKIQGGIFLLAIGCVLAVIGLIVEIIVKRNF